MKKIIVIFTVLLLTMGSCTKRMPSNSVLKITNLPGSFISINSDSDYRLQAPKGAIIKIPKGAFDVPANTKVDIEIKEAYSGRDIILAGLTTMSNGRPLSSGGMIFFNATVAGKKVDFKKKVAISIPAQSHDDSMQLFKGEIKDDISVNWIDPVPLDTPESSSKLLAGKALFDANCANCHKIQFDFTGPALFGTHSHVPPGDWIYRFIGSPAAMIAKKDSHAVRLFEKYKPTVMTGFPMLRRREINAIMSYVENDASLYPDDQYADSFYGLGTEAAENKICGYDTSYPPTNIINTIKPLPIEPLDKTSSSDYTYIQDVGSVTVQEAPVVAYNFDIKASGWYNVDKYLETATDVTLNINVDNTPADVEMGVYLFCPQKKIFMQAEKQKDGSYAFEKYDGKLPLALNDKAVILAFGSKDKTMYYGAANFAIALSQTISLHVKETTGDELKKFFDNNKIDDISLDIYTNEKTIKEIPCNEQSTDTLKLAQVFY